MDIEKINAANSSLLQARIDEDSPLDKTDKERTKRILMYARSMAGTLQVGQVVVPTGGEQQIHEESIARAINRPSYLIRDDDYVISGDTEMLNQTTTWPDVLRNATELRQAIRVVGRVELENSLYDEIAGTAWLVAEDIIVTNRHVAEKFVNLVTNEFKVNSSSRKRVQAQIDFREEHVPIGKVVEKEPEFRILEIIEIVPEEVGAPDLAIFRVVQPGGNRVPIRLASKPAVPDSVIGSIGYPTREERHLDPSLMDTTFRGVFDVKHISPGRVIRDNDGILVHDCSTLRGSSGSLVVDLETGEAVGLHFAGGGHLQGKNFAVSAYVLRQKLVELGLLDGLEGERTPDAALQVPQPLTRVDTECLVEAIHITSVRSESIHTLLTSLQMAVHGSPLLGNWSAVAAPSSRSGAACAALVPTGLGALQISQAWDAARDLEDVIGVRAEPQFAVSGQIDEERSNSRTPGTLIDLDKAEINQDGAYSFTAARGEGVLVAYMGFPNPGVVVSDRDTPVGEDSRTEMVGHRPMEGLTVSDVANNVSLFHAPAAEPTLAYYSPTSLGTDIMRATARGADVVAVGTAGPWTALLAQAVSEALESGSIVLAAASNLDLAVLCPANLRDTIPVFGVYGPTSLVDGDRSIPMGSVMVAAGTKNSAVRGPVATLAGIAALWLSHHGISFLRECYPGASLSRAFLDVLHSCQASGGRPWSSASGRTVDAEAVLRARLPVVADREGQVSSCFSVLLASYESSLSGTTDSRVNTLRSCLGQVLSVGPDALDAEMEHMGAELTWHLTQPPNIAYFRQRLRSFQGGEVQVISPETELGEPSEALRQFIAGRSDDVLVQEEGVLSLRNITVARRAKTAAAAMTAVWSLLKISNIEPIFIGHRMGATKLYPKSLTATKKIGGYRSTIELLNQGYRTFGLTGQEIDLQVLEGLSRRRLVVCHDPLPTALELPAMGLEYALENSFRSLLKEYMGEAHYAGSRLHIELKTTEETSRSGTTSIATSILVSEIKRALDDIVGVGQNASEVLKSIDFCSFSLDLLEEARGTFGPDHGYFLIAFGNTFLSRVVSWLSTLDHLDKKMITALKYSTPWLTGVWFDPSFIRDPVGLFSEIDNEREKPLQYMVSTYYSTERDLEKKMSDAGALDIRGMIFDLE